MQDNVILLENFIIQRVKKVIYAMPHTKPFKIFGILHFSIGFYSCSFKTWEKGQV